MSLFCTVSALTFVRIVRIMDTYTKQKATAYKGGKMNISQRSKKACVNTPMHTLRNINTRARPENTI